MLKPEFELLSFVKEHQPCIWSDVINSVSSDSECDKNELNTLLRRCLEDHRWIRKTSAAAQPPLCAVCMTDAGTSALFSELETLRQNAAEQAKQQAEQERAEAKRIQERLEDRAEEERRYRTQNKISIIMPLVTFVLGMIVEHCSGIISLVSSLLH